uniref:Uncharacterized protein n=1 Tax=Zea mays TaxID=4577 RepID=C4J1W7_MAIZE|nr:unknown [Zea mays]ACR36192.1 unknown [Zea mays]
MRSRIRIRDNGFAGAGRPGEAPAAHEHGRESRRRAPVLAPPGGQHRAGPRRERPLHQPRVLPQGVGLVPRDLRLPARGAARSHPERQDPAGPVRPRGPSRGGHSRPHPQRGPAGPWSPRLCRHPRGPRADRLLVELSRRRQEQEGATVECENEGRQRQRPVARQGIEQAGEDKRLAQAYRYRGGKQEADAHQIQLFAAKRSSGWEDR